MNRIASSTWTLLMTACGVIPGVQAQGTDWPLQPTKQDHPLGATLGEFVKISGAYQHEGIDILAPACKNVNLCEQGEEGSSCANPCDRPCGNPADNTSQGCVFSTVGGVPVSCNQDPNDQWTSTDIRTAPISGKRRIYQYYHLTYGSFDADYMLRYNAGLPVESGKPINRVGPWTCNYDHLHYGVYEENGEYLNPLQDISPALRPDPLAPDIFDVYLAPAGIRWSQFSVSGECTVVKGKVEIVAHHRDRDDAGSTLPGATNVGIYKLRWRACALTDPDCDWNDTNKFATMPLDWDKSNNAHTIAQFSTTSPYASTFALCPTPNPDGSIPVNQTFMVATGNDASSSWDTTKVADGTYAVSVEASDLAGNKTTRTVNACVLNEAEPKPPTNVDVQ
jgi:hypothetical protein